MGKKQIDILKKSIVLLRAQLDELITDSSFTDPEVVRKSQELDELIAKYYELIKDLDKQ